MDRNFPLEQIKKASSKHEPEEETKAEETEASSEESKKKIKILETNMDPLEYFSRFLGIPEMIFDHLNGTDLIKYSEVNPNYYNFIASSKVLMEKIKVVFDKSRKPKNCVYNLLKNSSRLYQNIEIGRRTIFLKKCKDVYITNSELECLQDETREWKIVSLKGVCFRKRLDLWNSLKSMESSVECISVIDFSKLPLEDPTSPIKYFQNLKFPKLKQLKLFFCAIPNLSESLSRFLLNSVSIEELDFENYSDLVGKEICTKMLENFDKLTSLRLRSQNINQMFKDESWKRFQFKLKSLAIIIDNSFNDQPTYFRDFLKSQSDIEKLSIDHYFDKETFDVIMKMPNLKRLCIFKFHDFFKNEIQNEVSSSITELELKYSFYIDSLRFLLLAMPNLRKMKICSDDENYEVSLSTNEAFYVSGSKLTKIVNNR